jgi:serine/threonine protein phosphatase PrpC
MKAPDPGTPRPADDELDFFGLTDRGKVRPDNQDQFLVCTIHPQVVIHGTSLAGTDALPLRGTRLATLLLIADGVGGAADGSEAARVATEAVTRYVSSTLRCYHAAGGSKDEEFLDALRSAALEAHAAVRSKASHRPDGSKMATTLTLSIVVWPWLYVVQVGDSRAYFYDGELHQITRDQTIGQELVDQGILPADRLAKSPFKHVLSSAIGADEALPVVTRVDIRTRGAIILMCSDGLTKHVTDAELASALKNVQSSEKLVRDLLELALSRGGSDNITIIAARAQRKRSASNPSKSV